MEKRELTLEELREKNKKLQKQKERSKLMAQNKALEQELGNQLKTVWKEYRRLKTREELEEANLKSNIRYFLWMDSCRWCI